MLQSWKKELIKKYKDVVKRTKDLVFHKIGSIVVYQTDNILISKFDTLIGVGVYANYMTIYTLLTGIVEQAFMGITASIRKFDNRKNRKRSIQNLERNICVNVICNSIIWIPFL